MKIKLLSLLNRMKNSHKYKEALKIEKDNELINVLIDYFSKELEEGRKIRKITNKYINPKSRFKTYQELYSDFRIKLYKTTGEIIEKYKVDIKINSINKTSQDKVIEINNLNSGNMINNVPGNKFESKKILKRMILKRKGLKRDLKNSNIIEIIRVDLDKTVNLKYKGLVEESKYTDNHIIYLNKRGNIYLVEKDINEQGFKALDIEKKYRTSSDRDYIGYINSKIEALENEIEELKNKIKDSKNGRGYLYNISKDSRENKYRRDIAARWAMENVYETPDYSSDCSNFVSNALHHGGLPKDGTWYKGSNAWIRVLELRNWLIYKGYAKEYKETSMAEIGDVIQLYRSGFSDKWGWQHSLIITHIDDKGGIYVSARTRPALNVSLLQYYPSIFWSDIRLLKIKG